MFGSPERKPNSRVATSRGSSSVAELVIRYQNILDRANPSSADQKTKSWEESFSKKREAAQAEQDLPILPSGHPGIMNIKKSREKLALQQASPSATEGKNTSQTSTDSRRGASSPNTMGDLTQTFHLTKTGNKMETLHRPKFRFQPWREHPVSWPSTKRSEEQGTCAPHAHNGDSGRKEALCIRSNAAAPSTKLTVAYTVRQVNNYEKLPGVLVDSGKRSHTPLRREGRSSSVSVKERSALYHSRVAAAAASVTVRPTEWVGTQDICGLCCMPVRPTQRLTIQNVLVHQMCFCCQHCRRKLSLLNYAVFQGAFCCKVCCKLLSEVIRRSAPNTTLSPNHQQLLQKDTQPNPRRESKNKSSPTGRILVREKMPPRFSNLRPQGSLGDTVTSQDRPKTIGSPLKKDAKDEIGRKYDRYGTKKTWLPDPAGVRRSPQRADGSHYKTWEDKSRAESSRGQKKRSQLPKVIGPKSGDRVLHWIKKIHESQDLGGLENRQLFVEGGTIGVEVGKIGTSIKIGSSVSEKARRFQSDSFEVERSISKASSLSLNLPKSSLASSFLSPEGALRRTTVTPVATTAGATQLAKDPFQGKKPGAASSWKVTADGKDQRQNLQMVEPLPKVRTLPALAPPLDHRSKKKLQRATQGNTLNTLVTEDTEEPDYNSMAPMKNEKPSQSRPEGLVSSPGHEEKKNNQTEHREKMLAANLDPMKSCLKTNQEHKPSWISRNEFLGEAIEILHPERRPCMDNQLFPETHPLKNEEVKKNEMHPRGIPDSFESLMCIPDLDSQNTEPKDRTSSSATDGDIEDGSSLSSSQADDVENREVLPRNNLQDDATLICNTEPPIKITNTNEKLPAKASSGHNLQLAFQEDTSRDTSLLASASYTKDPEILLSCKVPCLIEKQETGDIAVEIKAQNDNGSVIETSQGVTDKSARKQPLKKQNNPFAQFFAFKTQRSVPDQKLTSGTKKAPKTQSALVTLFGHSVNKDKSQKEWPRKDLGELSGKVSLQSTHYSNLPNPDCSKKEENSGVVMQTRNSGSGPQYSEESHGICSKENQSGNSPSLDSVNTFSLELGRDISSPIGMQSGTKSLDIPRQSNLNTENTANDHGKSLPFTSFQNGLASTENMSQYSTNALVETSVACRNTLSEQGLYKFSNLAKVDSQDLERKARNVSLLDPLREDETQALDEDSWVPDTLSSCKGVEGSANMGRDDAASSPGLDTDIVQMKDDFCSGSAENLLQLSSPQCSELELNVVIKDGSLSNRQPPETGDPPTLEFNSDHPFELNLHVEQATNEGYSIGEYCLHPALAPSRHMPELLRDTLQGKAAERSAGAKSPSGDRMQEGESDHPQGHLL